MIDSKNFRCVLRDELGKSFSRSPSPHYRAQGSNQTLVSILRPSIPRFSVIASVCGILGLLLNDSNADAAPEICEGLSLLQHRGQDACGIITCGPGGRFYQCKANGMVRDIFDANSISRLIGGMGVGHGK